MAKATSILMTADTVGGIWTYAMELSRALIPHEICVTLATLGGPVSDAQRKQLRHLPNVDLRESNYRLEWMDEPWSDVDAAGEWLWELARETSPDIVHLNSYSHGSLPWPAPCLLVAHSCVFSWWRAVHGESAPSKYATYRHRITSGLDAAQHVVAPTFAMLCELEELYGPVRSSSVIHNGTDIHHAPVFAGKHQIIFTSGRVWDEAKNVRMLESVAADLAWPVFVAGDSTHPGGHRSEFRNLKLLEKLPPQDVLSYCRAAAIYASPALYEPFGLAVLEAASCGCALVLSDIPSFRELWEGAARFVPTDDQRAWRHAIQQLIDSPSDRTALGARALERAHQYSSRRMGERYAALYSELARTVPIPTQAPVFP